MKCISNSDVSGSYNGGFSSCRSVGISMLHCMRYFFSFTDDWVVRNFTCKVFLCEECWDLFKTSFARTGTWTLDPQIKSLMLYRLSYPGSCKPYFEISAYFFPLHMNMNRNTSSQCSTTFTCWQILLLSPWLTPAGKHIWIGLSRKVGQTIGSVAFRGRTLSDMEWGLACVSWLRLSFQTLSFLQLC